jgi:hypothetical protein
LAGAALHFQGRMGRFGLSMPGTVRRKALLLLLPLAGCTAVPQHTPTAPPPRHRTTHKPPPAVPRRPPPQPFRVPEVEQDAGLGSVIEKDAATLTREFGPPRLDVHEGDMRKLQFAGPPCVLDVFLYPLRPGAEPVATSVDARRESDGRDVDSAACVAALSRGR